MKRKLFLPFFLIFLFALTIPLLLNGKIFKDAIVVDIQDSTEREVELLAKIFVEQANISFESAVNLLKTISSSQLRSSFIDKDGLVLYDSNVLDENLAGLENHISREEVIEADKFGLGSAIRLSSTVGFELVYVAKKIEQTKSFPAGYLRIAVPTSLIFDRFDTLMYTVFTILIAVLILIYTISHILNKKWQTALDSLQEIIDNTASTKNKDNQLQSSSQNLPPTEEFKSLSYAISEMNSRVKNQLFTINKQKNELEGILNSINAGVMLLDERGIISLYNKAFYEILPNSFIENDNFYLGKKTLEVINSPELDELITKISQEDINYLSVQLELEAKIFQVNITKSTIESEFSSEVQLLLVFHDITQLAQLVQIKRELIANVSHELRTPLTAIQGYAETLQSIFQKPEFDKEQSFYFAQIITKNAQHLDRIVNDLLTLSILESNEDMKNLETQYLNTKIETAYTMALEECVPLLEAKKMKIENLMDMTLSLAIDKDRLSQVFRNVLENAIHYSPYGESIVLKTIIEENQCSLFIQDYGVGIPQEDLSRVFERFYRVEKHRTHNGTSSTGLGLSICKHIIEKANGSIFALYHAKALLENNSPEKMVGATIRINLPLAI